MMEMRWLEYTEEETVVPPSFQIQYGSKFDTAKVVKKKLQYRVLQNTTVYAGMPDGAFKDKTANIQWSNWIDVPTQTE